MYSTDSPLGFSKRKIRQASRKEGNPCGSAKQIMACFGSLLNVNLEKLNSKLKDVNMCRRSAGDMHSIVW